LQIEAMHQTIRVIGADLMKRQLNFALSEQA
jgi:hypothetical protein